MGWFKDRFCNKHNLKYKTDFCPKCDPRERSI